MAVAIVMVAGFMFQVHAVALADSVYKLAAAAAVIEGEKADSTTFVADARDRLFMDTTVTPPKPRDLPALHKGKASLLCTKRAPAGGAYRAVYSFALAQPYAGGALWVFEQGREWASPFRWRIDTLPWVNVPTVTLMQRRTAVAPGGPEFAWARLGKVPKLGAGKHRLTVEVSTPKKDSCYLLSQDCFALMRTGTPDPLPFIPDLEAPTAKSILLWGDTDTLPSARVVDGFRPWLEPYPLPAAAKPLPAVIVFPGGGYNSRATYEGTPVAKAFNAQGFHAFVCQYRVAPHRYPEQLLDAAQAVRIVRSRAAQWKVDPKAIAVCGFSAGGHLAAMIGVHHGIVPAVRNNVLDSVSCRPNALILGYPAITNYSDPKRGNPLVGDSANPDIARLLALEQWVTRKTPQAFLWHCFDDPVSIRNSMVFADSLRSRNVACELHIYHKGGHGLGIAPKDPHVATWVGLAAGWLKELGSEQLPANPAKLKDGVYPGRFAAKREPYVTDLDLHVKAGKIAAVKWIVTDTSRNTFYDSLYAHAMAGNKTFAEQCRKDWSGSRAYAKQLVATQDIDKVDAVSGATWSHRMFKGAVNDALIKAGR